MKILNVEQYNEKLKINPVNFDEFEKIKIYKKSGSNTKAYKLANRMFTPWIITDGYEIIDNENEHVMVFTGLALTNSWTTTIKTIQNLHDKFGYQLRFDEHMLIRIRCGSRQYKECLSKSYDFFKAFEKSNIIKIQLIGSYIDCSALWKLVEQCNVTEIILTDCELKAPDILNKECMMSVSKNKNLKVTTTNSRSMKLVLDGLGWK